MICCSTSFSVADFTRLDPQSCKKFSEDSKKEFERGVKMRYFVENVSNFYHEIRNTLFFNLFINLL